MNRLILSEIHLFTWVHASIGTEKIISDGTKMVFYSQRLLPNNHLVAKSKRTQSPRQQPPCFHFFGVAPLLLSFVFQFVGHRRGRYTLAYGFVALSSAVLLSHDDDQINDAGDTRVFKVGLSYRYCQNNSMKMRARWTLDVLLDVDVGRRRDTNIEGIARRFV
jgi:hypothetical protein